METALLKLTRILESTGMSRNEAEALLAKFLEEEAFDYVEFMNGVFDEMDVLERDDQELN